MSPSKDDDDLVEDLHALDITTTTTTTTNIITQEVEEEDDDETNGNYIPFRMNGKPAPGSTKSDIPRYLYRICTANSRTDTDSEWIQSRDAADDQQDSETDIFARTDKHAAAEMINAHLRRKPDPSRRDNLVSWTSSLLKALLFIFDRHTSSRPDDDDDGNDDDDDNDDDNGDSLELEDIYLCMLDTSSYNEGAYIRAPSLLAAFREYSTELAEVEQQRSTQPCHWGEYLTQGRLNIEGACEIVSADGLVERGLFTLLPELEALAARWKRNGKPAAPSWDEALEKLRGAWEGGDVDLKLVEELTDDEERCAGKIAELFGVYLQTPLAAALAALRPRREGDPRLAFRALRTDDGIVDQGGHCSPAECNSPDSTDDMPEVKQFRVIMTRIFAEYFVVDFKYKLVETRWIAEETLASLNELVQHKEHLIRSDVTSLFESDDYYQLVSDAESSMSAMTDRLNDLAKIQ